MFRFHTGSIKRGQDISLQTCIQLCFDSILVRLKVFEDDEHIVVRVPFRFHTGSIKSMSQTTVIETVRQFRFHTGSIKRASGGSGVGRSDEVSIPYWFD